MRFGAVSSILVAFRMLIANSASDLQESWLADLGQHQIIEKLPHSLGMVNVPAGRIRKRHVEKEQMPETKREMNVQEEVVEAEIVWVVVVVVDVFW